MDTVNVDNWGGIGIVGRRNEFNKRKTYLKQFIYTKHKIKILF